MRAQLVVQGSAIDRLALSVLIVSALLVLMHRNFNWRDAIKQNRVLILLYVFMAFSLLWSDYPWISLKRWVKAVGPLLMAWIIISEANPSAALDAVLRRSVYILIPLSLVLIKYFPNLGVQYEPWTGGKMWVGVTTQKNCLGRLCMISAFYLIWTFYRRRKQLVAFAPKSQFWIDGLVLLITIWILKGPSLWASSATAFVSLILGLVTFFGLVWLQNRWNPSSRGSALLVIVAVGIILGITIPLGSRSFLSSILSLLGRDTTFTGRTDIWAELLPIAWKHPLLGLGYGGFWVQQRTSWAALTESHNGYVEIFLELGVVGIALVTAFLFSTCARLHKSLDQHFEWAAFGLALLIMVLFHNITEVSFVQQSSQLWTILVFVVVLVPHLRSVTQLEQVYDESSETKHATLPLIVKQ